VGLPVSTMASSKGVVAPLAQQGVLDMLENALAAILDG